MESHICETCRAPQELLPKLFDGKSIVLTQEEVTSEELTVDKALRRAMWEQGAPREAFEYCWGSTLFHKDDLPFRKDSELVKNIKEH